MKRQLRVPANVWLAAVAVLAGGCHSLDVQEGFRCSTGNKCPPGYQCVVDRCYLVGHGPDGGAPAGGRDGGQGGGLPGAGGRGTGGTGGATGSGGVTGSAGATGSGGARDGGTVDAGIDAAPLDAPQDIVGVGRDLGAVCTDGAQCTSSSCVDGLCCDTACTGSCVQCNLRNFEGRCTPVPAGNAAPAPRAACVKAAAATCKENGFCDGRGGCQLYASGEACGAGGCNSTTSRATTSMTCDGLGVCKAPVAIDCAPFKCNAGLTACATSCLMDVECQGQPCVNGSCGKVANGNTCTAGLQCVSGNCVDGYCCDLACTGSCQACDLTGAVGKCTVLTAGQAPRGGRAACVAGTCGSRCDGTTAGCTFAPVTTACGGASCVDGRLTAATTCSGTGACTPAVVTTCGGFGCAGTQCKSTCLVDGDCSSSRPYCSGAMCQTGKPLGRACVAGTECASANCVDGVCCSSASCGTCRACNLASPGTCTNRPVGAADPACPTSAATCQAGGCSALGACLPAPSGTVCGAYTCSSTAEIQGQYSVIDHHRRTCDGTVGAAGCKAAVNEGCPSNLVCADAANCKTSCSGDGDCLNGFYCAASVCTPRKGFAAACTTSRECATRYCVRGSCQECSGTVNGCPQSLPFCDAGRCTACGNGISDCNADGTPFCEDRNVNSLGFAFCTSGAPTCNFVDHHCYCGATSGDCARGMVCVSGVCKIDGRQACVRSDECASGVCTLGLCTPSPDGTLCRGAESFTPTERGGCAGFCFAVDLWGTEQCGP